MPPDSSKNDLIIVTGDTQTIEGQYNLSKKVVEFAKNHNVKFIITLGGFSAPPSNGADVLCAATNKKLLQRIKSAGAEVRPGMPILGTVGLIVSTAKTMDLDAACLLGRTLGHIPDPSSFKRILKEIIGIKIDENSLDDQIAKSKVLWKKIEKMKEEIEGIKTKKIDEEKVTYIT
ncbi:MAG: PAC2 family protein [Candidatus Bathyarchaeota archaeon]